MTVQPLERDTPVLELDGVDFRRGTTRILDGVSLTVRRGEHWALLGPNGSGKSTLLSFCGAIAHPTSGTVRVLGERLGATDVRTLRRLIGYVDPRHALRSPRTVRQIIETGVTGTIEPPLRWRADAETRRTVDGLAAVMGLGSRLDHRWPTLSQGERGRTLIARALVARPVLLLLDEPGTGLDLAARELLLQTLTRLAARQPALASVVVTHHLEDLPPSTTHAALLADGRIRAAGLVRDVLTDDAVSRTFGCRVAVSEHDGRWSARSRTDPTDIGGWGTPGS
ncbi:MAG: ATP-binding cassette domain-containing protein [Thermoleophilia bacterium]